MRFARLILAVFLLCLTVTPSARAESLIVTLSDRTVDITSNFTGSSITIFGAVRRDAFTVPRASDYDVVVTVTGPPTDHVARLKDRVFGIWINRYARRFDAVPSAYAVLSNRPVEDIAHPALLRRFGIGINHLLASEEDTSTQAIEDAPGALGDGDEDEVILDSDPNAVGDHIFERAFLRLQRESQQYQEDSSAVAIIDNSLFRARATFPADVPLGNFNVRVFLFSGGVMLAEEEVGILVRKTGFEQIMFRTSQREPLLYGLIAVALALFTGWLGGIVFRRS